MIKKFVISGLAYITILSGQEPVFDQNLLISLEDLTSVNQIHQLDQNVNKGARIEHHGLLTEYILLPGAAKQTWILALYDFATVTASHYHNEQNQLIMILEGKLKVRIDTSELVLLAGQYAVLPLGSIHALYADDVGTRMLILDIPGYDFPYDRLTDKPLPQLEEVIDPAAIATPFFVDQSIQLTPEYKQGLEKFPAISEEYYQERIEKEDNTCYQLISLDKRWNIAINEIRNTIPQKFTSSNSDRFIVLNGELFVKAEEATYHLMPGQSVRATGIELEFWTLPDRPARVLHISHH